MDLPFSVKLPDNFGHGSRITIEAKPTNKDAWFSLTFFEGNQILVDKYDEPKYLGIFQIQLRVDEGLATLNSVGPGAHVEEERVDLGISKDSKVKMDIHITKQKFKILINGEVFARFNHRHDITQAKYVNIYGCFNTTLFEHSKKYDL